MSARDPRRDPKSGDVVEKGSVCRTVLSTSSVEVSFVRHDYRGESYHCTQLTTWRAWWWA